MWTLILSKSGFVRARRNEYWERRHGRQFLAISWLNRPLLTFDPGRSNPGGVSLSTPAPVADETLVD